MKIMLSEADVIQAVVDYVGDKLNLPEDATMQVEFEVQREGDGMYEATANVTIDAKSVSGRRRQG